MADEKKDAAQVGPLVAAMRERAPSIMAELMETFIKARDLNSRARVRMQMKAMLDLFSTDTDYPPVPALNDEQRMGQELGGIGIGRRPPVLGPYAVPAFAPAHGIPAPVRPPNDELRAAVEEAVVDGVPTADVIPAPGAPVAEPAAAPPG